jgi:transcription initiation factor TFIIIB Brf1 subunit/transcription initiation factor TFIIB
MEMKNENEEKTTCDDCGGLSFTMDTERGEEVCNDCGLVIERKVSDVLADNGYTQGEGNQQNERVDPFRNASGQGTTMNPFSKNNKFDANGVRLTPKQAKAARRRAMVHQNSNRETDPMCYDVKMAVKEVFGEDIARATSFMVDAACRKLTPAQEATRRTLKQSEKKALILPKQSMTRGEKGVTRGHSTRENNIILAIAIVDVAAPWLHLPPINADQFLQHYGLVRSQLNNAKKLVTRNYKARCRQGWARPLEERSREAQRENNLDNAAQNLDQALAQRLSTDQLEEVFAEFFETMTAIEEPGIHAYTSNVSIKMIAGCVMYSVLTDKGLADGNLERVAHAVGFSGAGLRNRLSQLAEAAQSGAWDKGDVLFTSGYPIIVKTDEDATEFV